MPHDEKFITGEFRRLLDERFRLSIPTELAGPLTGESTDCVLVKERMGCLSLFGAAFWNDTLEEGVAWVRQKMARGKLDQQLGHVQLFGRLLSTRHLAVQLGGRGRLLIPEGFREFLDVEPGGDVIVVGAAICVEIWNPAAWRKYLETRLPKFRRLLEKLSE